MKDTRHDRLKQDVLDAIVGLYGDTSVSLEKTFDSLTDIKDQLEERISVIEEQIKEGNL